ERAVITNVAFHSRITLYRPSDQRLRDLEVFRQVLRMSESGECKARHLFSGVTQDLAEPLVHQSPREIQIDVRHPNCGLVEGRLEKRFAFSQPLLRMLARGDVREEPEYPQDAAILIHNWGFGYLDGALLTS